MKKPMLAIVASIALASLAAPKSASGQNPVQAKPAPAPTFRVGTSGSDVAQSKMTAAEIRQARALYRAQQRVSRLEYNLWMGYEPLRPNWNSVPMMSSRYGSRRVYVPVYVHTRY